MRNVKIKTTYHHAGARNSIQHPAAKLGKHNDVLTVEIRDVPGDVTDAQLLSLWDSTTDLTWLSDPRYAFDFSELGVGQIIR